MRIVGGRHRGRVLAAPTGHAIRPTADRIREAIFNILAHGEWLPEGGLSDLDVVDLFAGTGAMGLEALSRGARHVVFVDDDQSACRLIRDNLATLGETVRGSIVQRDVARLGLRAGARAALAFVDPPYGQGLVILALAGLLRNDWLAPGAMVVVEQGTRDAATIPEAFTEVDRRRYGSTTIVFLRRAAASDT